MSGGPDPLYVRARTALLDDADLCVVPTDLRDAPLIAELLEARGFLLREHPGAWTTPDGIPFDLMVPEAVAGAGTRGARLGPHGRRAARRARGLEGALVDREHMEITSLHCGDERSVVMLVAGPAALLVAKVHRLLTAPGPLTESATRTRWISCVSCRPPKQRRSPRAWGDLRTMNSAR